MSQNVGIESAQPTPAVLAPPRAEHGFPLQRGLSRHRGLLIAVVVLALLLALVSGFGSASLGYYDVATITTTGSTLAIAAMGQTLVVLSGGFDLSAGAIVSLVNVVLASAFPDSAGTGWVLLAGIGVGALAGAFNGFFIAVLRMQPIVVTLSTMFIIQGITLLVMDKPGGAVPAGLGELLLGDAVPDLLPRPAVLLLMLLLAWSWLKNTRLGRAIYAIGSDADAARSAGVPTRTTEFLVYLIAGGCYGLAGVFISAQTGSADPLIGTPMLLQMFAAVVVGGSVLGGGRGGLLGTLIGAYVLMLVVNLLLTLNVSAFYSTIAEGSILLAAVLAGGLGTDAPLRRNLRQLRIGWQARRAGQLATQRSATPRPIVLPPPSAAHPSPSAAKPAPSWWLRHAETLRYSLPAYAGLLLVILVTQWLLGHTLTNGGYYNSLLVLASFLAVLALGQGAVILTGGLDLSIPWTIGLCGILLAGLVKGSDAALLYALPAALGAGLLIGFINGAGIVLLGLSPIVMTMAANAILQGLALLYSNGTPDGFASPLLRQFMTDQTFGVTPVVLFVALFVVIGVLLLNRTAFGRAIYAVGNGERVAKLSGVRVGRTVIGAYMLSGLCSAIAAVLLTGLSGQASLGMGDDYLLPSIAVVVVGGTLIAGGRGHYLGMLGGVLMLTALQTLLAGSSLPYAARSILFGLIVLAAVVGLRERRR
ncbi:ABC transporter permease [Bordetella genomosp. 1]|uniref:ABC transporter permease n=1 Tax=Bordetella genomosp. 1 TaxID=1395607 RepID=A0A261SQE0_9BORD|nr:ABC transporter permease [Bordetella genomosp. 1]OZI39227.1 ABC transporter permease [Bordetella genomosp. 1]